MRRSSRTVDGEVIIRSRVIVTPLLSEETGGVIVTPLLSEETGGVA
jgi:hypothetical protein